MWNGSKMTLWKFFVFFNGIISVFAESYDSRLLDNEVDLLKFNSDDELLLGDMYLSKDQVKYLFLQNANDQSKFGLLSPFFHWPFGIVYFSFDENFDEKGQKLVIKAMEHIENASCIRFEDKDTITPSAVNYVLIKKGKACSSKVGMRGGIQPLVIDSNSCSKGSIVHELLHTLGFLHMHTSPNRNDYINVNWNNIKEEAKLNFKKTLLPSGLFGTEYDYDSITHYSGYAFAKNKSIPTIRAKKKGPNNMGQRKEMSPGDISRLLKMYSCDENNIEQFKILQNNSIDSINNTIVDLPKLDLNSQQFSDNTTSNSTETTDTDDDEEDMILSKEQMDALYSTNAMKRNGLKSVFNHWPMGVVIFQIDESFSPEYVSTIYEAMNHIAERTCIKFMPRFNNFNRQTSNYVNIKKGSGCNSEVGMRNTGSQTLNLDENLCTQGKIIHELLHAIGLLHLHTANERDNYIRVNWSNIRESALLNFKQFLAHVSMFSTPYDYDSIMHYSTSAFAKDKSIPTIIPLHPAKNIGQRTEMTEGDAMRVNRMYKCENSAWSYQPLSVK